MKKLLLLMLSFFMVLGVGLAKASSRIDAMSADINVVEDYDLIFTYPNKVLDYKNIVDLRLATLGSTNDNWAGVLDGKFEKVGVLGVYIHRPNTDIFGGSSFRSLAANNEILPELLAYAGGDSAQNLVNYTLTQVPVMNPLFDLFWGKEMGNLGLGVKVDYADSKVDSTNGTDYQKSPTVDIYSDKTVVEGRQLGIQFGVGMKDLGPFQEANFAAGYAIGKVQMSYQQASSDHLNDVYYSGNINDNGIYAANLNVNLRHDIDANNNLKVYAAYSINNFGLKGVDNSRLLTGTNNINLADSDSVRTHQTVLNLGLGVNHTVNEGDGLVAAGVKAIVSTTKDSASFFLDNYDMVSEINTYGADTWTGYARRNISLPVFLSAEAKVKGWLTLRAGASYYLMGTQRVTWSNAFSSNEVATNYGGILNFNTGFGLNWKNWVLDGVLDTNALEDSIANVQPGRGLMFRGNLVTVATADLKYKF